MDKTTLSEKQKKKIIIIAAIVLLLIIILLFFLLHKKTYEITFDSNGGTDIASVKVRDGDKLEKPDDPTREGYIFEGWYYLDELYDFEKPVKSDMTLKAEWAEQGTAEITGIQLDVTELTIAPDGTAVLVATLQPEDAKQVKLIWTSSDESILTVDENGNIKALKEGTATITVTTEDGKFSASCKVVVSNESVAVERVEISGAQEVNVGETIKLNATIYPDNATNKELIWKSSNSYVAKVDKNGNVTGLKAGKVTITVKTVDGGYEAKYTITVKSESNNSNPSTQSNIEPSSVNISGARDMTVGETGKLNATISPNNANSKTRLTWSSSNSNVVTVDSNGNIKAVGEGSATITVTTENGKTTSVTINVKSNIVHVTDITITGPKTVYVGESIKINATVSPSNATNSKITWSVDKTSIATIDQNGNLKGVSSGTVIVTATADGVSKTYTVTVNVKEAVYELHLTPMVMGATNSVTQYSYKITKDGANFTEYIAFNFGGRDIGPVAGGTIDVDTVTNNKATTVKLTLQDGTTKQAKVVKH